MFHRLRLEVFCTVYVRQSDTAHSPFCHRQVTEITGANFGKTINEYQQKAFP